MEMPKPKSLDGLKRLMKLIDAHGHDEGIRMFMGELGAVSGSEKEEASPDIEKKKLKLNPKKTNDFMNSFKKI